MKRIIGILCGLFFFLFFDNHLSFFDMQIKGLFLI